MSRKADLKLMLFEREPTVAQLKERYRTLAFAYHPDRGGDVARFAELGAAYQRLMEAAHLAGCPTCAGKGKRDIHQGFFTVSETCPDCGGRGHA